MIEDFCNFSTKLVIEFFLESMENNQKSSKVKSAIKFIIMFSFMFLIMSLLHLLRVDPRDIDHRLKWFDPSLVLGGVRHYTIYMFILAWSFGAFAFQCFHMNSDPKRFKCWIDGLSIIKGVKSVEVWTILPVTEDDLGKLRLFMKIICSIGLIGGVLFCK